jgi:hypothetical protein
MRIPAANYNKRWICWADTPPECLKYLKQRASLWTKRLPCTKLSVDINLQAVLYPQNGESPVRFITALLLPSVIL